MGFYRVDADRAVPAVEELLTGISVLTVQNRFFDAANNETVSVFYAGSENGFGANDTLIFPAESLEIAIAYMDSLLRVDGRDAKTLTLRSIFAQERKEQGLLREETPVSAKLAAPRAAL